MAVEEWVAADSPEYAKILRFNDAQHPVMVTGSDGIDCVVYEAYSYVTKAGKILIGLVAKVQAGVNLVNNFEIAGEYITNDIIGKDLSTNPPRFLIRHRQLISLDDFNHIIDLNRPDILDPQTVFNNRLHFKEMVHFWVEHNWIAKSADDLAQKVPDGRPDLLDERIPDFVTKNAAFRRALSDWRTAHWVTPEQAKRKAITQQALATLDDELSFRTVITH